jgi:hypothetical protein
MVQRLPFGRPGLRTSSVTTATFRFEKCASLEIVSQPSRWSGSVLNFTAED